MPALPPDLEDTKAKELMAAFRRGMKMDIKRTMSSYPSCYIDLVNISVSIFERHCCRQT